MAQVTTIWLKELRDNFRDRRTLTTALLMPLLIMPLILIGTFKLSESQVKSAQKKVALIGVAHEVDAPTLVRALNTAPNMRVVKFSGSYQQAIEAGTINVYLDVPADFESNLLANTPVPITVYEKSSNYNSSLVVQRVTNALDAFNRTQAEQKLAAVHISSDVLQSIVPRMSDISTPEERGGFFASMLLPMFIVLFAIIGGMYIAIDVSAGEKERKTLEPLLYAPVAHGKVVAGKFLAVATMAIITIILSLGSLYASFKLVPPPNMGIGTGNLVITLTMPTLLLMLGIGVILAVMFSGLLLSVAIFAKSYKEAQNYISPFYILAIIPVSLANAIPGFKASLPFFLIPGVNATFVMKEALMGTFIASHIYLTIGSLIVFALLGIIIASRIYSRESILFRD